MSDVDKLQDAQEWADQKADEERKAELAAAQRELEETPAEDTAGRVRRVAMINISDIADRDPLRISPPKVHQLAVSIRQRGLARALTVRPDEDVEGQYVIVTGHRQLAALRELHGEDADVPVPCQIIEGLTEADIFALQLTENEQREDLDALQIARAARRLQVLMPEITAAELAKSLGMSPATLANRFKLLDLPDSVQELLEKGDLSFTAANMLRSAQEKDVIDEIEAVQFAGQIADGTRTYTQVKDQVAPSKPRGIDSTVAPKTIKSGEDVWNVEGGADTPFDSEGRAKKDTWDRTTFEADEARAAAARSDYLESEADRLMSEAGPGLVGPLPTQRAAGDDVTTTAVEEDAFAMADLDADQDSSHANVTPQRDQLHALMFARMLRDWADDEFLEAHNIDRADTVRYSQGLPYAKRVYLFYNLAARMGGVEA